MSLTAFPEPKDLSLPYENTITDGRNLNLNPYSVENPHPGFGKDPNILNEFGHTKYPMWVDGPNGRVIVQNAEEAAAVTGEKADAGWGTKPALRDDGPTIQEYVAAGYKAKGYPPAGYASKSTDEEVEAAIKAEEAAEASAAQGWGNAGK